MNKFHRKCGDRVTLLNQNLTAIRNFVEFNHGLILSADSLTDDALFEVRIDRKLELLLDFLEKHRCLALGRVRGKEGSLLSKRLWAECADILNSDIGGAHRESQEWKKDIRIASSSDDE